MGERFIGLVGTGKWVYPHTRGPDGKLHDNRLMVCMAGLRLPTTRIPLCIEHDRGLRAGWVDWFEMGADHGVRVHGEVDADLARQYAYCGQFPLSWYIEVEESVPFRPFTAVNGELIHGGTFAPKHIITRSRIAEVSLVRRPVNPTCYGRLLHAGDPPDLRASAFGSGRSQADRTRTSRIEALSIRATAGYGGPAIIRAAADGSGKLATFSGLAYSGQPMTPTGWNHPVVIVLDGVKLRSPNPPALRQHDLDRVVGHMTKVRTDRAGIHVEGIFSGDPAHVAGVVGPATRGFPWQMSVGANPTKTSFVPAGETATVNGREVNGPCTIAHETELGEVSFVAIGADADTTVDVQATKGRGRPMYPTTINRGLAALLSGKLTKIKAALKLIMAGADKTQSPGMGHYSDDEIDSMTPEHAKAALKRCMKAAGEDVEDDDDEDDEDKKAEAAGQRSIAAARSVTPTALDACMARLMAHRVLDPTANGYRMG